MPHDSRVEAVMQACGRLSDGNDEGQIDNEL
jgi:hypothetical protein